MVFEALSRWPRQKPQKVADPFEPTPFSTLLYRAPVKLLLYHAYHVLNSLRSSPTPSDDTFLLSSNPIPDPAPHKTSDKAAEKTDEDLEIIESEEAAEVLNELNEAEWSDVEAH